MKVCIIKNAEAENISAIYRVVNALISSGNECIVLSRKRQSSENTIVEKELLVGNKKIKNYEICINSEVSGGIKNIFNLAKYIRMVKKWLINNKENYDVVHSFDLDTGLASYLARKKTKIPYVYHIADFYVDSRNGIPKPLVNFVKKLEFKIINNSETTIICTEQRKEQIEGSRPKNLVVVHNSPAKEVNAQKINDIEGPIKLAYVGGLTENRFIKEIQDIIKEDRRFCLEIAGAGPLKDITKSNSEEYNNINYYGQVSYEKAIDIYKDCDIIVAIYSPAVKNHRYSAPNKFYEAMMLGKSIIVSENTGVDKLVEKENIGYLVKYDKNHVRKLLDQIYKNTLELKTYKQNAIDAYKNYSYTEMQNRIKNIYDEM